MGVYQVEKRLSGRGRNERTGREPSNGMDGDDEGNEGTDRMNRIERRDRIEKRNINNRHCGDIPRAFIPLLPCPFPGGEVRGTRQSFNPQQIDLGVWFRWVERRAVLNLLCGQAGCEFAEGHGNSEAWTELPWDDPSLHGGAGRQSSRR